MYNVLLGSKDVMEKYKEKGVRGLNTKTHKWQVIEESVKYEIVQYSSILFRLTCNRDLKKIAEEKGLIL